MNIVIVTHQKNGCKYLFSVPENVMLKEGDIVLCDTSRGEQVGHCCCDSFHLDGSPLKFLAATFGARFPLKPIVGRCKCERWVETEGALPY